MYEWKFANSKDYNQTLLYYLAEIVSPKSSIYGAGKAALSHFARAVAMEEAKNGIRVNILSPGVTITGIIDDAGICSICELKECKQR